jgi:hypothetical protein
MEYSPYAVAGIDQAIPVLDLANPTSKYLQVLPDLFALWVPGNLQARRD